MPTTLAALAELVGGRLVGARAGDLVLIGAATLDDAEPGDITLLDSAEKAHRLARSRAGAVLVPRDFLPDHPPAIEVDDVHAAFAAVVVHFRPKRTRSPRRSVSRCDRQPPR